MQSPAPDCGAPGRTPPADGAAASANPADPAANTRATSKRRDLNSAIWATSLGKGKRQKACARAALRKSPGTRAFRSVEMPFGKARPPP